METKKEKVAIQGTFGAFHEIAARQYFKRDIEIIPCETFSNLFDILKNDEVDYGAVAIENTIAGSLLPNYQLLKESGLRISGEINLHISQNLMALPGQKIDDIQEVYSHPIAIQQSEVFFKTYPHIKLIESADTAISAMEIAKYNKKGVAGIGSVLAAKIYGLEILAEGIETNKRNFTRFLIIGNNANSKILNYEKNKASLCFSLPHEEGSLSSVLAILAFYKISLTKIQSSPILGREFEYFFHVDVMFNDYEKYCQAINAVKPLTRDFEIFGEYMAAPRIEH